MRNYQTLGLIGTTIGILLMLSLLTAFGFLGSLGANLEQGDTPVFLAGLFLSLIAYVAALTIIFVTKQSKAVGIMLIVIGLLAIVMTNGWGIIPFAILLPAGIVALRYKRQEIAVNNNGDRKEVVKDGNGKYYIKE